MSNQSITELKGVGVAVQEKLAKLHIKTVLDLVLLLPSRYENRTFITKIAAIQFDSEQLIQGVIQNSVRRRIGSKICFDILLKDDTGVVTLRYWFYSQKMQQTFVTGRLLRVFGKFNFYNKSLICNHPDSQFIQSFDQPIEEQSLTPIYPTTEGLGQKKIRVLVLQALEAIKQHNLQLILPLKYAPPEIVADDLNLYQSLKLIHQPPEDIEIDAIIERKHPLIKRVIYEEFMANVISWSRSLQVSKILKSYSIKPNNLAVQLLDLQPFNATKAQLQAFDEISIDLQQSQPMNRLLQGDVGCGKTLVAAMIIAQTVANKLQACFMVPTDLLARQQYTVLKGWFEKLNYKVALITGKLKKQEREQLIKQIREGQIHIVVGTHALFQETVHYHKLALIIIDEQHRFGVNQRLALSFKSAIKPHQLVMTATPIPRTLAMSLYGQMEQTFIKEMPKGRIPIITKSLTTDKREKLLDRIEQAINEGKQIYWLCTLIKENETFDAMAAEFVFETLQNRFKSNVKLIHAKMPTDERTQIMHQFKEGNIRILVATTVIEVGVDVSNASIIIIENPERLGMSQLHQLRGRVGRGEQQSYCILLHKPDISDKSKQRIDALCKHQSGQILAEIDLKMRGPGELLGTKQTGLFAFKIADISRDQQLLFEAKHYSKQVAKDKKLVEALINRWLPYREQYINA